MGPVFLLDGGDCAQTFKEFNGSTIRDIFHVLLKMFDVLTLKSTLHTHPVSSGGIGIGGLENLANAMTASSLPTSYVSMENAPMTLNATHGTRSYFATSPCQENSTPKMFASGHFARMSASCTGRVRASLRPTRKQFRSESSGDAAFPRFSTPIGRPYTLVKGYGLGGFLQTLFVTG